MPNENSSPRLPDYLVSVAAIADNDQSIIDPFIREVVLHLSHRYRYFELVIIDNHSTDNTYPVLLDLLPQVPGVRVIRLSRHHKAEIALAALLDHCIGDFVVVVDCRNDPVDVIPAIINLLAAGADVVTGQHSTRSTWGMRAFLSTFSQRLTRAFLDIEPLPQTGICRGFSRRALNSITKIRNKSRFIIYDSLSIGYRSEVLCYSQAPRKSARGTDISIADLVTGRLQMVIAHSLLPLRLAGLLGVLASFGNMAYLLYVIAVASFKQKVAEGWTTTSLLSSVMFFALFFILAILTEYIGRILEETKDQPLYFVETEHHSAKSTYDMDRLNVVNE